MHTSVYTLSQFRGQRTVNCFWLKIGSVLLLHTCVAQRAWSGVYIIDKFPDSWPWINKDLEPRYRRDFRSYGWYFRKSSLARKRETTEHNNAKLGQPKQNMAASMYRDKAREKVVNMWASIFSTYVWCFVFTRMPGGSYRKRFRSLLLCPLLFVWRLLSSCLLIQLHDSKNVEIC